MTERQILYQLYCEHCEECDECQKRPTFDSPRCKEGQLRFDAWWEEKQKSLPL